MKKVLLFGSFDGIHEGHKNLIAQAKNLGGKISIALAGDEYIENTKNKKPKHSLQKRIRLLKKNFPEIEISTCDEEVGVWDILKKINPDIIFIGYDQDEMEKSLNTFIKENRLDIKVIKAESFKPEIYKSSIINNN